MYAVFSAEHLASYARCAQGATEGPAQLDPPRENWFAIKVRSHAQQTAEPGRGGYHLKLPHPREHSAKGKPTP